MHEFESLSKGERIKRLKLAMDAAVAIDGMWFLNLEELLGFEKTNDVNLRVWEHYPKVLHRRMTQYYALKKTGLEGLTEMLKLDPMLVPMESELTGESENSMVFRVHKCPGLEAQERMNRREFTCERVETAYLEAFARLCDPRIKIKALKLPPRASENDICCEWRFSLDP